MQIVKSKAPMYKTTRKLSKLKECPYCKAELTETEREFFPCTCTFQACVDCYKDITKNKGVCPSCHSHLKLERLNMLHASKREELTKKDIDKVQAKKTEKKSTTTTTVVTVVTTVSSKGGSHSSSTSNVSHYHEEITRAGLSKLGFTELSKLRVIQKNMVYVIGLAPQIATADTLEKFEYFGQYGKITKTIVNKSNVYNAHGPGGPSYSAYVTFSNDVEASTAILAVDEVTVYDRIIRASYGTTKYCTFFLRDKQCPNPGCLYLHSFGKEKDSFVKDENVSNRDIFNDQQRLALDHIQKHYQEILRKMDLNSKAKTILPAIKTVQIKVQDYMAEIEKQKAALKAKEPALKTPEKPVETRKSKELTGAWTESTPTRKPSQKEKDQSSSVKGEEEIKEDESKEGNKSEREDKKVTEEAEKIETEKEDKMSKQDAETGSIEDNKEDLTAKADGKGDITCRSHRSYSNKSTNANSVKKESLADQKEEMDSRMSLKSTESANKELDATTKQEEATVQSQVTEDLKDNISLYSLIEKIQVKEINGDNPYQDDFDRKIIENLLSNLSSQSNSRFRIVQEDEKEDSDETKAVETGSDGWETKNEEFNMISKSIQEYIQSPTISDNSKSDHNSEENPFFTATKHMIDNFSTPTKKMNSNSGNKKSRSDEKGSNEPKSATYKSSTDESDQNRLVEKGQSLKVITNSNIMEEDKFSKGKMHKKNNKSSSKSTAVVNSNNIDKNGLPIKNDNKNIGNHLKNINGTQSYIPTNGNHNLIQTAL